MRACGGPVLRDGADDACLQSLTACVRFVKKSNTQLHNEVLNPRSCSLAMSLFGRNALKAEL